MANETGLKKKDPKAVEPQTNSEVTAAQPKGEATIHFEFFAPEAESVAVAGNFNDWQPEAGKMNGDKKGNWSRDLNLEPGTYEYCIVVDGAYQEDSKAASAVDNPFGGKNSVLEVAPNT